jgi:hypothetical protein
MLKKNPNERISLFQMKSYYSLQDTLYHQLLKQTLANVAGKKEEDLIGNILNENMKEGNCFIKKQILVKKKITDLIRSVKCLNGLILEEIIQQNPHEKEDKILTIRRKYSPSKYFKPASIRLNPQPNTKIEIFKQYSNQKRRQSIQHVTAMNLNSPFLKFQIPNLRFRSVIND